MPTFMCFRDGDKIGDLTGASPVALKVRPFRLDHQVGTQSGLTTIAYTQELVVKHGGKAE